MKLKLLCIINFAVVCVIACNGQTTNINASQGSSGIIAIPFIEKHDLDSGTIHGHVTLSIENPVIKAGEHISIKVCFVNTGKSWDFYNPFFTSRIPLPAQIALYDSDHNYICDLMSFYVGSVIGMSWDDWTFLPGGGCSFTFPTNLKPTYFRRPLPTGDYYLQIIYYKAFIALDPPWRETDPDVKAKQTRLKNFEAHFDQSELFRSNPVKFTIAK
jgi:hypothetical protein